VKRGVVAGAIPLSGTPALSGALALAGTVALAAALALALSPVAHAADSALSPLQEQGQKLYRNNCFYCHTEKVWGTLSLERRRPAGDALLEKRTDLTPEFLKSVVRNGLGSMPAYRRTELTDADVDAIIAYLTRNNAGK
jgi:mono/diheme cytochrome c family protein